MNHYGGPRRRSAAQEILGLMLFEKQLQSVVILYVAAFGMIWIAGKIYRVGILMYGKKPSFKEMIRWITYKYKKEFE